MTTAAQRAADWRRCAAVYDRRTGQGYQPLRDAAGPGGRPGRARLVAVGSVSLDEWEALLASNGPGQSHTQVPQPAGQASRTSCGFCGAPTARNPAGAKRRQAVQRAPAKVPSRLNVGRSNGHAVPGEGLFDSGEAVGLPPAARAQAVQERYVHRPGDLGPHPASGDPIRPLRSRTAPRDLMPWTA